jgi:hypothetical protein
MDKREQILEFLGSADTDCLVIITEDESEDIELINQIVRESHVGTTYNTVLCVGGDAPIFITPRDGISTKSKIILVVDGVPDTWTSKSNVVTFKGAVTTAVVNTAAVVTAQEPTLKVNKIESTNT